MFVKMDASANDVHPIFGELRGYPSVFLLPVGSKKDPLPFVDPSADGQQSMTYEALKLFALKESSVFLTEQERMGQNPSDGVEQGEMKSSNKDEL